MEKWKYSLTIIFGTSDWPWGKKIELENYSWTIFLN